MTQSPKYLGYIAMSVDGFIADRDGGVGWLDQFAIEGEDHGYVEFFATIDALLFGRASYEQVMGFGWPYNTRPAYVLTRDPEFKGEHVAAAGDISVLDDAIRQAGHQNVWVLGGGQAQRAALDAGMFDRIRVFVMPIILGGGIPLFSPGVARRLELIDSSRHAGGVVQIDYAIPD